MRLGAWMPFARAAAELAWFCGAAVGAATAARLTEAAGAAWVAEQTAEAEALAARAPRPPAGPPVQQLSADGAMVPLVGGEWAEVKTLAVGTVAAARGADGAPVVRTTAVSYFSRMAEHREFGRLALVETHARGTERAGTVVAVNDGAEWLQGFVDLHRPDAVRVLDFPHALEHLNLAAQAVLGPGAAAAAWSAAQARELKSGDPDAVLAALRALPAERAPDPAAAAAARDGTLAYPSKRRDQIAYARFRRCGFPIGSGMVESGHKTVVEARLKGAGRRWAPASVNPMAALRTVVCNDRWDAARSRIARRLRARAAPPRRRPRGLSAHQASRPTRRPRVPPAVLAALRPPPRPRPGPPRAVAGRPTAHHPWHAPSQDHVRAARIAERRSRPAKT